MKHPRFALVALFGAALLVTGCAKKASNEGVGTGFDSLSGSEELTSLPQATPAQQQSIEVLPIETSPVTQSHTVTHPALPAEVTQAATTVAGEALSYQQKIQTALKNAGLYQGPIDGKIGPASRRAIEQFQQQNGLKVDGKVGPKTWAVLEPYFTGQAAPQHEVPAVSTTT